MNVEELQAFVLHDPPGSYTPEEALSFLEDVSNLEEIPDRDDEFGEKLHKARGWHDFRYFIIDVLDMGWKEAKEVRSGKIIGRGFVFGDPDWPCHDQMVEFLEGPSLKKVMLAPRGSYKSTLIMLRLAWELGRNRELRILYNTETYSSALLYVDSMKAIMENEAYIEVFGKMKGKTGWKNTGLRVSGLTRTSKEASLQPSGLDKGITGGHYDIIINDDVVSETNTRTKQGIRKTINWHVMLEPILDPGSMVITNGTRYDDGDLFGHLKSEQEEMYDWLILVAENKDGKPFFRHLTKEWLVEKYKAMGSYAYSCQYMNQPVAHEDQLFFRHQFQIIGPHDVPTMSNTYLLADTATSAEGSGKSRTALIAVAVDSISNIYVLDVQVGKWKPDEVVKRIFAMCAQWRVRHVTMEQTAWSDIYRALIDVECKIRQIFLRIRSLRGRSEKSKEQRILSLQPVFEQGKIFWLVSIPHELLNVSGGEAFGEIPEEFIRFPKGKKKDIADALSDVRWHDRDGAACPGPRYRRGQAPRGHSGMNPADAHPALSTVNGKYPANMPPTSREPSTTGGLSGRSPAKAGRWQNKKAVR